MKTLIYVFLTFLMTAPTWAQTDLEIDSELNAELDQLYVQQGFDGPETEISDIPEIEIVESQPVRKKRPKRDGQSVYIVNQADAQAQNSAQQRQGQAQRQPVTVIQSSPLTESNASRLRKARVEAETRTEMKIVEKLEQSRIEDEKRRAQHLFGESFNNMNNPQGGTGHGNGGAIGAVVPVSTGTPTTDVVEGQESGRISEEAINDIRGEIRDAVGELKAYHESEDAEPETEFYGSALLGFAEYPDAINVRGKIATGFNFGARFNKVLAEGSFLYARFEVEDVQQVSPFPTAPFITAVDQYSLGGAAKYQFLEGMIRPFVGASLVYSYRNYEDTQFLFVSNQSSSHALDMGFLGGVDLQLTKEFALGTEFRYMFNVTSQTDSGVQGSFVNPVSIGTPLEEMSYYFFSVHGRFFF